MFENVRTVRDTHRHEPWLLPKAQLITMLRQLDKREGRVVVVGSYDRWSKDELVNAVIERGA